MTEIIEKPERESASERYFIWLARIAVCAGMVWLTVGMGEAADKGEVNWMAFPAFTLLVICILVAYGAITQREN